MKGLIGLALVAALVAPAAAHADATGLVAAYGFEEASGTTATDSSTAGNNGALINATRTTSGRFGRALSFDGVDDLVTVADANSLDLSTGMTLEAWVNPTAANANWRTVLLKEQPAALAYALYSDEGAARPSAHAFTSREYDTRGTAATPLNAWSHLSATYDGATLRLYVNGIQVSSRALTGALKSTTGALRIGGNAIWGEYFKGLIDEVRVYNRALTAAELVADMGASVVPPIPADTPPTAPGNLTTSVTNNDVTLSWTAATDDVGVTNYRIHRSTTPGFTPSDATNAYYMPAGTSLVDMGRAAGTYYYKVVAYDTTGKVGPPSNEASATVQPSPPPTAPSDLTASVDDDDVALSWTASTDDVGVTHYNVHRSSTPGFAPTDANRVDAFAATSTSMVERDQPVGTWYYKVIARDAGGSASAPSNEVTAIVGADTTPPTVSWAPGCGGTITQVVNPYGSASDGRPGDVTVDIYRDGTYFTRASGAGINGFRFEFDPLYGENGTYAFTAVARDAAGNEATSAPCEYIVDHAPLSIAFTSPADGATVAGTVSVQADSQGAGWFTRIRIDGQEVAIAPTATATYSWNTGSLPNGSTHTLTAEMLSNYPASPPYKVTTIQVTADQRDVTPPAAPDLFAAADSAGDVHLSIHSDPDVNAYRIHRSPTAEFTPSDANLIKATPYDTATDGSRPTGTWYYRAVAVDDAGNRSAPSNEVAAIVAPDAEPPNPVYIEDAYCGSGGNIAGTVTIKSFAYDNRWVKQLQLELDGEDLGAPFVGAPGAVVANLITSWDTRLTTNGLHVLTAVARDLDGNETTSAQCTYTVDNSAPPTVSVTAPADGATVSATRGVSANASDDRAVKDVQFKLDGNALGAADTTVPYSISWDTATAPNGSHTITAVARDYDGNTTTSSPVTVTVSNADTSLVAAYGFEETSGTTAADSSGKGNAGTVSGATQSASGKFGRAMSFDGVNDVVSVADASSLDLTTALTLEGWVKPTTVSGSWRTLLLKERPGGLAYALYAAADNGRASANLWAGGSEAEVRGATTTPVNAWTHLATTYNSVSMQIYVNGGGAVTRALTSPVTVSTGALKIGGNAIWPEWFKGLIDEVRVYNRALNAAEVAADRDRPVVP